MTRHRPTPDHACRRTMGIGCVGYGKLGRDAGNPLGGNRSAERAPGLADTADHRVDRSPQNSGVAD